MLDRATSWRGFRAMLTELYDGDTFRVLVDGGFDGRSEPHLRLVDVHAPELIMRLPRGGQPGGQETTEFVAEWMGRARKVDERRRWWLWIDTLLTVTREPEQKTTFRRYLARVWQFDEHERGGGEELTLNHAIRTFLSGHPEWPPGD